MESYIVTEIAGASFAAGCLLALDRDQLRRRRELVEVVEELDEDFTACRARRGVQFKLGETVRLIEGPEVNKRLLEVIAPADSRLGKKALAKAKKLRAGGKDQARALRKADADAAAERAAKKQRGAPGAAQAAENKKQRAKKPPRQSERPNGEESAGTVPAVKEG